MPNEVVGGGRKEQIKLKIKQLAYYKELSECKADRTATHCGIVTAVYALHQTEFEKLIEWIDGYIASESRREA